MSVGLLPRAFNRKVAKKRPRRTQREACKIGGSGATSKGMGRIHGLILAVFSSFSFLILAAGVGVAQDAPGPEEGGHEVQVWAGGGHSVAGGTSSTGIFDVGLRYGWVITGEHWPGILRGRFEYAVDAEPAYLIFQPANTAYGVGFNPLGLKWNFVRRGRFSPYLELSGGTLFSNHNVPTYTNTVNFTSAAALGMHVLGAKYNWSVELRYLHISNAGLATPNPGLNTVQVRVGVGRFSRK
jgi:lipid A 3-O-deacylase